MPAASFMPAFFGDMFGIMGTRFIVNTNSSFPNGQVLRMQSASRGSGWKAVDNESPRPQDRIYYTFNYYNDVGRAVNAPVGGPAFQGYRHIIGLEKTLFSDNISVGLRLPFVDITTPIQSLQDQQFGDISIVTKWAPINEPDRVLSGGLIITVPTGAGFLVDLPNPSTGVVDGPNPFVMKDVVLQPWLGYQRYLTPRFYWQGITSIGVPTDGIDVTIYSADLGVGYWIYRSDSDSFIRGIVPTFEAHANIPLNHRGMQSVPIGFSDQLNLTSGVYVIMPRAIMGCAVGVPVVGPKPYDFEINAYVGLHF